LRNPRSGISVLFSLSDASKARLLIGFGRTSDVSTSSSSPGSGSDYRIPKK
jgi:hypothetical protein